MSDWTQIAKARCPFDGLVIVELWGDGATLKHMYADSDTGEIGVKHDDLIGRLGFAAHPWCTDHRDDVAIKPRDEARAAALNSDLRRALEMRETTGLSSPSPKPINLRCVAAGQHSAR